MPENEEKDTSPEGAGDPDSSGANQSEDPPEPSGANQSGDSPEPSGADQGGDSSVPSGLDQGGDLPEPSGADQGGDSSGASGRTRAQTHPNRKSLGTPGSRNTCTCDAAQGQPHKEGCPLYVPPDVIPTEPAKECNCGHEDGTHTENCPLYVAPEGLEEEEEQEESNGASLSRFCADFGSRSGKCCPESDRPGGLLQAHCGPGRRLRDPQRPWGRGLHHLRW